MLEMALSIGVVVVGLLLIFAKRRDAAEELDSCYDSSEGERFPHKWGYTDTRFEFDGPGSIRVTGSRYPLAGYNLPGFIPFGEEVLGQPLRPQDMVEPKQDQPVPEPKLDQAFVDAVKGRLEEGQISLEKRDRLVHSHGQLSVDEIYKLLYGDSLARIVDIVLYPQSEADVRAIVELGIEHDVCLVPYGGGTNVSGALTCPPAEQRTIVSIDMRRMARILWLDEENLQACIEAGISGKQLEKELDAKGFTCGHDPDSVELSTLGGWIATNASGMKKNKYGNIEDIVLEASLITPTGDIETYHATPRNSVGIQPRVFLFGNEGNLGIITKAVIKVHPRPQVRRYGALVFPHFKNGVRFLKELRGEGALPASIRLVNNTEFRFGQALKPAPGLGKKISGGLQKFMLLKILGFKPLEIAACTIVMEGSRSEVAHQKNAIFKLAKKHGGISAGASNGKRGYMLTFAIAYIRDFFNQFHILGETFETSVPWDRIHPVCQAVQHELTQQCQVHEVYGSPYLAYRVTQTYPTGVCIYFTMGFSGKGLDKPEEVYHEIEHRLRQVILDNGGSLSHHHGIGKIRQRFLSQIQTENSIQVLRQVKKTMDPNNTFGIGNGVFADLS
jgi:alkyldihydroxyacetonephosphate synthase